MSEPARQNEAPLSQEDTAPRPSWQADLKHEGAGCFDPVRLHYLEVLSQRVAAASADVRPLLADKFTRALADHRARFQAAQQTASDELAGLSAARPDLSRELQRLFLAGDYTGMRRLAVSPVLTPPASQVPLAQLNQYIRHTKQQGIDQRQAGHLIGDVENHADMASVHRFRQAWSRIAAQDQVEQAVDRGPVNAGPLNSHVLVLRSLALMRKLSPDYLQRFLSHVDTLLWLDQANQKYTAAKAKPVRRPRPKK